VAIPALLLGERDRVRGVMGDLQRRQVAASALAIFVAVPFAGEALRSAGAAVRQTAGRKSPLHAAGAALWNLLVVVAILLAGRWAANWVVALAAGLRLAATTAVLAVAPVHSELDTEEGVIADIGIDRPERLAETGARLQRAELERVSADRSWILSLLAVLFVIHVSRMGFDRSALGILSPLVAVIDWNVTAGDAPVISVVADPARLQLASNPP